MLSRRAHLFLVLPLEILLTTLLLLLAGRLTSLTLPRTFLSSALLLLLTARTLLRLPLGCLGQLLPPLGQALALLLMLTTRLLVLRRAQRALAEAPLDGRGGVLGRAHLLPHRGHSAAIDLLVLLTHALFLSFLSSMMVIPA